MSAMWIGRSKSSRLAVSTALALLSTSAAWAQSGNGAVVYTYDALGRVTSASYDNNTTITYTYDAAGNRTSQAVAVGSPPGSPPSPPPTPGLLPGPTLWSVSGSNIYYNPGNVGIGTASPAPDVPGRIALQIGDTGSSVNEEIRVVNSNAQARFYNSGNLAGFGTDNAIPLGFFTSGGANQRMIITSTGLIGIGTAAPAYTLHVNGTAYATAAAGALSDRRHKDHIESLALDGLATVEKLRPVSFVWKEPTDDGMKGEQFGFIAQEVEKFLPQVVLTANDKEKTKGLKYDELIPVLTLAVQELKAANDSQAAEIHALRNEIDDLKSHRTASYVK